MKKLLHGIAEFRKNVRPGYRETFARLALGQSPDTLLFACSDSRVAVNLFASTDPGDLFVVRNVGNLIPPCGADGVSASDESEAAAVEFAMGNLAVTDVIVCGHSECGAMQALLDGREKVAAPNLRSWLRHAEGALAALPSTPPVKNLSPVNALSRLNVLLQMGHLRAYPSVKERLASGKLRLHGWWFDIAGAEVYVYDGAAGKFTLLDEKEAERRAGD